MSLLAPGRNFPSLRSMLPHTETKFYGAGAAVCHLCGSSAIRKLTELRKAWKSGKNTTWISRGYAFWYIPVDSAAYTLFNILYSYTWFIQLYNHILRICLFLLLITRDICNSLWKIASFTVTSLARPLPRQGNIEQVGSGWRKWLLALPEPAWKWTWIIPVLFFSKFLSDLWLFLCFSTSWVFWGVVRAVIRRCFLFETSAPGNSLRL